jgi:predicted peptidase
VRPTAVAVVLAVFVTTAFAQPQHTETGFLDRTVVWSGTRYRFAVYVPSEYTRESAWPILVDLHGNGAQGDDGVRQTAHFLADQIRMNRSRFPLVVVFPQAARGTTWATPAMQEMVIAEIETVLEEFHGDPHRVYLTGFSMGGEGVYRMAARWPERFAALVAIGGVVPDDHANMARRLQRIPLTIVHGARDERVPVEGARRFAAELKQIDIPVDYIEYADARHGPTAERAYADARLLDWLLAQRRP